MSDSKYARSLSPMASSSKPFGADLLPL
ncbi:uncharacterized protein FFE2_15417 [Fusarium fujikuroi]|nr:uncharacterized protein FFE2_15417 [Fusarium fujikuroi]